MPPGIAIVPGQAYMIIGVLTLEFRLHGNSSLKGKRQVAQSLKQKLRNTFNVAVSPGGAPEAGAGSCDCFRRDRKG
jgi:hypothetical protein